MRLKPQKNTKWIPCFLWLGAVLVSVKSVLIDFGIDNGYAIATSYRHISGDRMFLEMWEPHQTSAFLVDILMYLYRFFVPSFTGVAIYLQIMGVLLWIPIIVILHKELSKHTDKDISHLICVLLFVFRPKQTVFPEFSNMQIGFSMLLFIFLVKFICDQAQMRYLILSALFLCMEVLSYPTCMIAYAAAVGILLAYTECKWKNVLTFSGVCFVLGTLYTGYLIGARGPAQFFDELSLLIASDASHTGVAMSLNMYLEVFVEGAAYVLGTLAIAAVVHLFAHKRRNIPFLATWGGVIVFLAGVILFLLMYGKRNAYEWHYCIVLVLLIILGILGYPRLSDMEKKIWISGAAISGASFLAVAVLTNCALMSIVAYLPLAAAVSMIPLSKFRKGTFFAGAILIVILLNRGLMVWGYSQLSHNSFIIEAESMVRVGPALGIMCDDSTSCLFRDNAVDFERFIEAEDSVLFIKDYAYDPLVYVQAGVEIAISSTISSPTYDKMQIEYWERHEHKRPTIIAIAYYDGEIMLNRYVYATILDWVEERYEPIGDGTWWRFYRIKG